MTSGFRDLARAVRKRRTEVDMQLVPIVAAGRSRGIACAKLASLIAIIHQVEDGKRSLSDRNLEELLQS
jgi:2-dehydropantoate 2-reductase